MPHCIIEYSADISATVCAQSLCNATYQGALQSELFEADDIKTRALEYQTFSSGVKQQSFIHVVVKILSGRSLAQRQALSQRILTQLQSFNLSDVSLTVEICDIERESYSKKVI